MSAQRISMHRLQELVRLHRQGTSTREAARLLGMSRNTAREYREALASAGLLDGLVEVLPELDELKAALPVRAGPQETSTVEGWVPRILPLLARHAGPRAIYDRLRSTDPDFRGSLSAVKRLCLRLGKELGVQPEDVAIPVDTDAGEVAQVDFGYVVMVFDASAQVLRKGWVFVMVLGHSRHQFAKVVFDQRAETWQQLHVAAFAFFGGVPRVIVPDNLKAAVIRAAFTTGDEPDLHRGYRELARFYAFKIDPTPPRDPEKKGKVEAGVKYASGNFFATVEEGLDLDELNRRLRTWVLEVAGKRVHGTPHRRPIEVFEGEERTALLPLPPTAYVPVIWEKVRVHTDSHVVFDRRLYSVPFGTSTRTPGSGRRRRASSSTSRTCGSRRTTGGVEASAAPRMRICPSDGWHFATAGRRSGRPAPGCSARRSPGWSPRCSPPRMH